MDFETKLTEALKDKIILISSNSNVISDWYEEELNLLKTIFPNRPIYSIKTGMTERLTRFKLYTYISSDESRQLIDQCREAANPHKRGAFYSIILHQGVKLGGEKDENLTGSMNWCFDMINNQKHIKQLQAEATKIN